jgi:hypothetical protein
MARYLVGLTGLKGGLMINIFIFFFKKKIGLGANKWLRHCPNLLLSKLFFFFLLVALWTMGWTA